MVDQQHLSDFPIVCRVLLNTTTCTFASLNIALAHSANHLAHLRVSEVPIEVTKFKFAAIKQIRSWIEDSALAYSYNMTGALLQLITYEVCYPAIARTRALRELTLPHRDTGAKNQSGGCIKMD